MKNIVEFNQANIIGTEQPRPAMESIDSQAEYCMNVVLKELRSICPAWRNAIKTQAELDGVKKVWTKAFMENGIVSMSMVETGLQAARESSSDFLPSVGKFITWCRGDAFQVCFDRFMSGAKASNRMEKLIFTDATHANVKRKAVGDDEKAFKRIFDKWAKRFAAGEIPQDVPALPPKSVVMPTDIARERAGRPDPSQFKRGSVFARIAELAQGGAHGQ
ncbi:replication protein P [Vibrio algicola]|uniref:Replication protein P n=1 Tax=Vibrio algicola TaxID=2662262 RepID=A0A5Q0THH2_9VIBR|nr:replication protein P [Vibrio algicola]